MVVGNTRNTEEIRLENECKILALAHRNIGNKDGGIIALTLVYVNLKVRYQPGEMVKYECICNGKYMIDTMRIVSIVMRNAYHVVSLSVILYLVLDNDRGHGTYKGVTI